jgi:hypothetical protein
VEESSFLLIDECNINKSCIIYCDLINVIYTKAVNIIFFSYLSVVQCHTHKFFNILLFSYLLCMEVIRVHILE